MDWSWLLVLLCPIMMLFMMKGMHGGGNHKHNDHLANEMNELKKQNIELKEELDDLKRSRTNETGA